jgi:hypothetical protein
MISGKQVKVPEMLLKKYWELGEIAMPGSSQG